MAKRDIIHKLQDYTALTWNEKTVTSGTGGTFLKARRKTSRGDVYYKLSCYDRYEGIYGHESVNELIASRLLDQLSIPHIPYRLVHARIVINGRTYDTWLSESRDYRRPNERRQALDTYIDLNARGNEDPLEFCKKMGWQRAIEEMFAFDYLIINRDRHGANIEVILKDGTTELAPLFDHGLSLAYSCYEDEERAASFDPMCNGRVNNYLGSRSLENNLSLIQQGKLQGSILADRGRSLLFGLDDVISKPLQNKLWEIIKVRWRRLIDLGIAEECDS